MSNPNKPTQKDIDKLHNKVRIATILTVIVVTISMLAIALYLPQYYERSSAASFIVDDTGDAADANAGDGTCATAGAVCTLRAAIQESNALAGADTITFSVTGTISPGSYIDAISDTSGVTTITGPGAGSLTIDGSSMGDSPCLDVGNIDIAFNISGLTLQNCQNGLQINEINGGTISGLVINSTTAQGIEFWGENAQNTTITSNTITSPGTDGIAVRGLNYTITNNSVSNCGSYGINANDVSTTVTITGNTVTSCVDGGVYIGEDGTGFTITGNTITSTTVGDESQGDGIYIKGNSNGTVTNNVITGNANCGINIGTEGASSSSNYTGNTISSNSVCGIYGFLGGSNTFSNNTITSHPQHGIILRTDSNDLQNNSISSNGTSLVSGFTMPLTTFSYGGNDYTTIIGQINDGSSLSFVSYDEEFLSGDNAWDGVSNINLCITNEDGAYYTFYVSDDNYPNQASVEALVEMSCDAYIDDIFTAGATATSDYTYNSSALDDTGVTIYEGAGYNASPTIPYNVNIYAYSGVALTNSDSNTLSTNSISGNGIGISIMGTSTTNTIDTDNITQILGYDIKHSSTGTNVIDNTHFDLSNRNVTAGTVTIFYDTRCYVETNGSAVNGATCTLVDSASTSTDLGSTGADGYSSFTRLNPFSITSSGLTSNLNDYTLTVASTDISATEIFTLNQANYTIRVAPEKGATSAGAVVTDSGTEDDPGDIADNGDGDGDTGDTGDSGDGNQPSVIPPEQLNLIMDPEAAYIDNVLLIKFNESNAVYLVDRDQKLLYPILNEKVFESYGFDWNDIITVNPINYAKYTIDKFLFFPEKTPLTTIYTPNIYIIEDGLLKHIKNLHTFNKLGYQLSDVRDIDQAYLDTFEIGEEISL